MSFVSPDRTYNLTRSVGDHRAIKSSSLGWRHNVHVSPFLSKRALPVTFWGAQMHASLQGEQTRDLETKSIWGCSMHANVESTTGEALARMKRCLVTHEEVKATTSQRDLALQTVSNDSLVLCALHHVRAEQAQSLQALREDMTRQQLDLPWG